MKKAVIAILACGLAVAWTGQALAKGAKSGEGKAAKAAKAGKVHEARIPAKLAQLDLTDDQKTKIKAIITKAHADAKAAADKATKRQIKKDAKTAILAVLTDDQKAKLKADKAAKGHGKKAKAPAAAA